MEKYTTLYDVLIIGAGPSGSNAAISYKNLNPNLKVGLIDKSIFPVTKTKVKPAEAASKKQAAILIWVQLLIVKKSFDINPNKITRQSKRI